MNNALQKKSYKEIKLVVAFPVFQPLNSSHDNKIEIGSRNDLKSIREIRMRKLCYFV